MKQQAEAQLAAEADLVIQGYEMQKAFDGIKSHDETVSIANFDNDQDMVALAARLSDRWRSGGIAVPGFLIRGHGLYAWGVDVAAARRHAEGFEFLFECLLVEVPV